MKINLSLDKWKSVMIAVKSYELPPHISHILPVIIFLYKHTALFV